MYKKARPHHPGGKKNNLFDFPLWFTFGFGVTLVLILVLWKGAYALQLVQTTALVVHVVVGMNHS
jgi:hypothetical protein